jgi:hypothetical protein
MPIVFGPTRCFNIGSRELRELCCKELTVDKKLNLDAIPRVGVIYCPTSNGLCLGYSFSPTVKGWRENVDVGTYRNETNEQYLKDSFADQDVG